MFTRTNSFLYFVTLMLAGFSLNAAETIVGGCVSDVSSVASCSANDVSIANVSGIIVNDDGCNSAQDTISVTATFEVESSSDRYDIGLYFGIDGDPNHDGALSGSCGVATLPNTPPPFIDLDGDLCGDLTKSSPISQTLTFNNVKCADDDGDAKLDFPYCVSWQQNGQDVCSGPADAVPGAPSKCKCGNGFGLFVPAQIVVDKVTNPSGDSAQFNFVITGGPNNIDESFSLTDQAAPFEQNGLLAGTYSVVEQSAVGWNQTSIVCENSGGVSKNPTSLVLLPGENVTCVFTNERICQSGACDDDNICTNDVCDEGNGTCGHVNNTAPCADNSLCTINDTCSGGSCAGATKDCNDNNLCTTDSCDSSNGACVNTVNTSCNDGLSCTQDSCDAAIGCLYVPIDSDTDGISDCSDQCPFDPLKTDPGSCGCGVSDFDSDGDGDADCVDLCPEDPLKTVAGTCGCGVADTDTDGDSVADCLDNCVNAANSEQTDSDTDGTGDACEPRPSGGGGGGGGGGGSKKPDLSAVPDDSYISQTSGELGLMSHDSDLDGIPDAIDNCKAIANVDQLDGDIDGVGDSCDNCLVASNADQFDSDADGVGDACLYSSGCGCSTVGTQHRASPSDLAIILLALGFLFFQRVKPFLRKPC